MACFFVRTITNLYKSSIELKCSSLFKIGKLYLRHRGLAFKSPPYAIVDAFRLPPVFGYAFEAVTLMSFERFKP